MSTLTTEKVLDILRYMTDIIEAGFMTEYMDEEFGLSQDEWAEFTGTLPVMAYAYTKKMEELPRES
jgi:hypothetical protein